MTESANPYQAGEQPAKTPGKSNIKLILLVFVLLACVAWKYVDAYVFPAKLEVMYEKVRSSMEKHTAKPLDQENVAATTRGLNCDEVREIVGMQPTSTEIKKDQFLVEYYSLYGSLPLSRRYLIVVYNDKAGKHALSVGVEEPFNAALFTTEDENKKRLEKARTNLPDTQVKDMTSPIPMDSGVEPGLPNEPKETEPKESEVKETEPKENASEDANTTKAAEPSPVPTEKIKEGEAPDAEPQDTPSKQPAPKIENAETVES